MESKKIIILAIALGILTLASVAGTRAIYAQDSNGYPSIVQKLVERFNLDAGEVQKVFDEVRGERHQEMQARFEERLNQAVSESEITEEQKQAILDKKAEMQEKCEEMKDLSWEERRTVMEEHREEMKTWAEENGIEMWQLFGGMKGFRKGHFGFGK